MGAESGRSEVLAVAAFVPPGQSPAMPWREGTDVVMMPDGLVQRWELIYREYGLVAEMVATGAPGDRAVARRMATVSLDVAGVWREMGGVPDLPWWASAALVAAAQAFEYQARDWSARAKHDGQRIVPGRRSHREPQPISPSVTDLANHRRVTGGLPDVD